MHDPNFADSPEQYVRPFLLIQKDLQVLFDYIEPSDQNLVCYSYRIHELLIRTCIEIEANCKAILIENGYQSNKELNMRDYQKINHTHHLSSYEVALPLWKGVERLKKPFIGWHTGNQLCWYQAYNALKHNRHGEFHKASFGNLIEAICGLTVLLSAQFYQEDFTHSVNFLALEGSSDGMESAIGGYFRVKFPNDWSADEQYSFEYTDIEATDFRVQCFDYSRI
ncbi:hypothetical protein MUN84_06375 [Hymenobacter sp. 5516J-16]|uniref:hypothetical protein n=1 Tax=Hymenobacter sp. 5516J-16 TaxID=2932253 RepID=UPI001FD0ABD3|nr:hypothetical protein [Hymenobacter sp. 5516J-16]UOQ78215.1 hypothetical protein MUN84_06375 [Hymenobacter sp. 5516J-16]